LDRGSVAYSTWLEMRKSSLAVDMHLDRRLNKEATCGELAAVGCPAFPSPQPPDEHRGVRIGPVAQSSHRTPSQHSPWRVLGQRISYAAAGETAPPLSVVQKCLIPEY
jgi:hypothetical protein